jgi:hypothetical protein
VTTMQPAWRTEEDSGNHAERDDDAARWRAIVRVGITRRPDP